MLLQSILTTIIVVAVYLGCCRFPRHGGAEFPERVHPDEHIGSDQNPILSVRYWRRDEFVVS